uniref:ATP synthase F0 subunit 8 n=1 Tax=Archipsocus nomas TaxID=239250 RepID=A0A343QCF1_9NEOP|nr:ATP synthase F0 subunit 8 [Archipsocus nomas]ATU07098.1 ATP synthase F0 subunit 8 [Archipsocus nomas]
MPQMNPLLWMYLFMYFIFLFVLMNTKTYFFFKLTTNKKMMSQKNPPFLIWKW